MTCIGERPVRIVRRRLAQSRFALDAIALLVGDSRNARNLDRLVRAFAPGRALDELDVGGGSLEQGAGDGRDALGERCGGELARAAGDDERAARKSAPALRGLGAIPVPPADAPRAA